MNETSNSSTSQLGDQFSYTPSQGASVDYDRTGESIVSEALDQSQEKSGPANATQTQDRAQVSGFQSVFIRAALPAAGGNADRAGDNAEGPGGSGVRSTSSATQGGDGAMQPGGTVGNSTLARGGMETLANAAAVVANADIAERFKMSTEEWVAYNCPTQATHQEVAVLQGAEAELRRQNEDKLKAAENAIKAAREVAEFAEKCRQKEAREKERRDREAKQLVEQQKVRYDNNRKCS